MGSRIACRSISILLDMPDGQNQQPLLGSRGVDVTVAVHPSVTHLHRRISTIGPLSHSWQSCSRLNLWSRDGSSQPPGSATIMTVGHFFIPPRATATDLAELVVVQIWWYWWLQSWCLHGRRLRTGPPRLSCTIGHLYRSVKVAEPVQPHSVPLVSRQLRSLQFKCHVQCCRVMQVEGHPYQGLEKRCAVFAWKTRYAYGSASAHNVHGGHAGCRCNLVVQAVSNEDRGPSWQVRFAKATILFLGSSSLL